jgi:hypothetical protein
LIKARAGAPRGRNRATLRVLCLPLLLLPIGCRTYDGHRPWYESYDYGSYGSYHRREAPAPYVYRPPVFVVPRAHPPFSGAPERWPQRRQYNAPHRQDRGEHLKGDPPRRRGH